MSPHRGNDGDESEPTVGQIVRRKIEPDPEDPLLELLSIVADLEGCQVEDLPPAYEYVDHMVENLFSNPPPRKAQVELTFTYYEYRIELDQAGNAKLVKQAEPLVLDQ